MKITFPTNFPLYALPYPNQIVGTLVFEILVIEYYVINFVGHEVCIQASNLFRKGLWKEF